MKQEILHDIQGIAKADFKEVQKTINSSCKTVKASMEDFRVVAKDNVVTATCDFKMNDEVITASVNYEVKGDSIYADVSTSEVAEAVLGAVTSTPVMAAEDDPDAFDFDSFEEDEEIGVEPDEVLDESTEESFGAEPEEIEDPETDPDIETDNNIAGHYIVECDRCHGIFISALTESDQVVESITGVCPLCEKESDQYVKWVVKTVEFQ